jgi:hypothetical protein
MALSFTQAVLGDDCNFRPHGWLWDANAALPPFSKLLVETGLGRSRDNWQNPNESTPVTVDENTTVSVRL